jgi:hypothetical protein
MQVYNTSARGPGMSKLGQHFRNHKNLNKIHIPQTQQQLPWRLRALQQEEASSQTFLLVKAILFGDTMSRVKKRRLQAVDCFNKILLTNLFFTLAIEKRVILPFVVGGPNRCRVPQ